VSKELDVSGMGLVSHNLPQRPDQPGLFPGIKRPGPEADCSPLSSSEAKNDGSVSPVLRTPS
jgi:hypothetical protein